MARLFLSKFSSILSWITLGHTILFIAFWLTNSLFYSSTNDYLAKLIDQQLDYVSLLLVASSLLAAWSILRLWIKPPVETKKVNSFESGLFSIVSIVYVVFFYGSFQLLFKESPVQINRIGQLLGYFRIIPDTLILLAFSLLVSWRLRKYLNKSKVEGSKPRWLPTVISLLVFGFLWSLPLIFPPGSVIRGELPDKPNIIAHRGASMLAPENTLIAMQRAAELGMYGLETDIHLSIDGELFLMHDDTFKRTTDIFSIFPGRENDRVESFTSFEVTQLNSGKWFVDQDPFGAIKNELVTSEQEAAYKQQFTPTLAEMLEILRNSHQIFIFDLKQPPSGHPYSDTFFETCFRQIQQAGIDSQVWFLVNEDQLQKLKQEAPEMKAAYGADYHLLPAADALVSEGYQIVNVEYGISRQWIRKYQDAGLWVNIYTIDEPWQFSRLWLLGVNSITSSNSHVLVRMEKPIFSTSYGVYLLLWSIVGLLGLGLILPFRILKNAYQ
jgi:glycerophosphoryl diester phosphodiesterase